MTSARFSARRWLAGFPSCQLGTITLMPLWRLPDDQVQDATAMALALRARHSRTLGDLRPRRHAGGRTPRGPRRRVARRKRRVGRVALLTLALLPAVLGLSACGASGQVNSAQAAWCAFHVWRLERDLRNHHLGWAALQAVLSIHHCRRALR